MLCAANTLDSVKRDHRFELHRVVVASERAATELLADWLKKVEVFARERSSDGGRSKLGKKRELFKRETWLHPRNQRFTEKPDLSSDLVVMVFMLFT